MRPYDPHIHVSCLCCSSFTLTHMLLKSSLYVSSPLPSDIRLSSLSISLASTCEKKSLWISNMLLVQMILIKWLGGESSMDGLELKTEPGAWSNHIVSCQSQYILSKESFQICFFSVLWFNPVPKKEVKIDLNLWIHISFRQVDLYLTAVYLFEIATASLLPIHHVMEDGDHDIPQIGLRHQRHLQEWTNHRWDEVQLVFPWRRDEVNAEVGLSLYPSTYSIVDAEAVWQSLEL